MPAKLAAELLHRGAALVDMRCPALHGLALLLDCGFRLLKLTALRRQLVRGMLQFGGLRRRSAAATTLLPSGLRGGQSSQTLLNLLLPER